MDAVLLCDELLLEILLKLSPAACSSASLVSKRWLRLYRSSRTSLSLRLDRAIADSSLLSQYPSLSSLSVLPSGGSAAADGEVLHRVLVVVSVSCRRLRSFRFSAGPVMGPSLLCLSQSCTHLTSLSVSLFRPLPLTWVACFPALKELSVTVARRNGAEEEEIGSGSGSSWGCLGGESEAKLGLETVTFSGIESGDLGVNWLWRSCKSLKKLKLRSCEGREDGGGAFSSFSKCLPGLQEVELRTCRTIADGVLSKLAANCDSLNSLTIHDGGSGEGLLRFMRTCRCNLQNLDFRLPLDLRNDHLCAAAANFTGLASLRLQSCCLVTGEGLKALAIATSSGLRELALVNCDVVERDPFLLGALGQNLRSLKKLDLSYNDQLLDLGFVSMIVSCRSLAELSLRGCNGLTNAALSTLSKCCPNLTLVDVTSCRGIVARDVEVFVMRPCRLRRIRVEESKVTDAVKVWALDKVMEIGS